MAKSIITKRQKDISRLLREKKQAHRERLRASKTNKAK